jgi:hypothetical protein
MRFKSFIEQHLTSGEEVNDIKTLLNKLPKLHGQLVKGFTWKFQPGNTLHGDDEHIGYMDDKSKEIAVAAPWNYGREFTILHEIAHRVWEDIVPDDMKHEWGEIVKNTKEKQPQSEEELFCMAYANHYAKNKISIHDHPEWDDFIKRLPK